MNIETKTGFVTLDEVRTLLGDTDPNTVSSTGMRKLLGDRGSFGTIDKFLNVLRAELAAASAPPVAATDVPAMPTEVANQMWIAAWTAAQVQTMARSEKLAAERDAALLKLETMGHDVAGLVATVDEQSAQLEQATEEKETAQVKLAAALNTLQHQQDQQLYINDQIAKELAQVKAAAASDLNKSQTDATHAAEIAEAGRQMMREELARLTDQVGELKAHLYKRADSAAVSPPAV